MTAIDGSHVPAAAGAAFAPRPGNRVVTFVDGMDLSRRVGEAIAAARHSVWTTVAFLSNDFVFPGHGILFDVLDATVARGVDVRLLAWRPNPEARQSERIFGGSPDQLAWLAERRSPVRIRWDRAGGIYCQHQKSWVIDAGTPGEISFVGGLNLTRPAQLLHDVYAEIVGPAATDLGRNFIERWNDATDRHAADGGWNCGPADQLPEIGRPASPAGDSTVQVQRMFQPGRYPPERVERSIVEQYVKAIDAARRTIYLENQAIPMPVVAEPLLRAVARGVEVVLLVPAVPEHYVFEARHLPAEAARFEGIEALGRHPNFTLAGLTELRDRRRHAAYVHAKLMIVDDAWVTLGSCNLHPYSLNGHSEMNASVWDARVARDLRQRLFVQHLGEEAAGLDDRAGLALFRERSRQNAARRGRGDPAWHGLAFALVPEDYATPRGPERDLT